MSSYFEPDPFTAAQAANVNAAATDIRTGTTQVSKDYPDLAALIVISGGAGLWALGAWVTIVAANTIPASLLLGCIVQLRNGAAVDVRFEIGTGGAGSEVVIARVRGAMRFDTLAGLQIAQWLPTDHRPILPVNARLSARCATAAGGGQAFELGILTVPTPL